MMTMVTVINMLAFLSNLGITSESLRADNTGQLSSMNIGGTMAQPCTLNAGPRDKGYVGSAICP